MSRALLAAVAVVVAAVAIPVASAKAPPAPASCTVTAEGPFLYVDTVIPVTSVQCGAPQHRLRIETVLLRDGVVVASASRSCRDASVCWLSIDASVQDEPGNQLWCTVTRGYDGSTLVGEARSCESEEF